MLICVNLFHFVCKGAATKEFPKLTKNELHSDKRGSREDTQLSSASEEKSQHKDGMDKGWLLTFVERNYKIFVLFHAYKLFFLFPIIV